MHFYKSFVYSRRLYQLPNNTREARAKSNLQRDRNHRSLDWTRVRIPHIWVHHKCRPEDLGGPAGTQVLEAIRDPGEARASDFRSAEDYKKNGSHFGRLSGTSLP
ncbi:hypothetical protein DPMN_144638 [Dreissena polymorpha]|uniref:Uncharacterized protein n=1 Tax=Dreissena polymorpha TaxID=45954 RepID=A0A9D4F550_DREPO|nr:hypothetical protein DPMN_144638 [Dreissena polymorpha]